MTLQSVVSKAEENLVEPGFQGLHDFFEEIF